MIITNTTTDNYHLKQLNVLLKSIAINSPGQEVTVFVKDKVEKPIEMVLYRIENILECMSSNPYEPIMWIDVDAIVRGDLTEFMDIEPNDFKVLYRPDGDAKSKFNAGCFVIRGDGDYTIHMMETWRDALAVNMVWGNGQLELWNAYKFFKSRVNLVEMTTQEHDLGSKDGDCFRSDSLIWHCKKLHFNNQKYQKEFKKYVV